eukprot:8870527-Heterocapsa_arctica.AAC.1
MSCEAKSRGRDVQLHVGDAAVPGRARVGGPWIPWAAPRRANGESPTLSRTERQRHGARAAGTGAAGW